MNHEPRVQVGFTPLFTRFLKHLAKRYRSIRQDLQPLIDQLASGETPGDQIKGTKYPSYKVRLRNSDVVKGKSGGYRVIYYIKTANRVLLLAIYAKTQQVDIEPDEIRRMIEEFESLDD